MFEDSVSSSSNGSFGATAERALSLMPALRGERAVDGASS